MSATVVFVSGDAAGSQGLINQLFSRMQADTNLAKYLPSANYHLDFPDEKVAYPFVVAVVESGTIAERGLANETDNVRITVIFVDKGRGIDQTKTSLFHRDFKNFVAANRTLNGYTNVNNVQLLSYTFATGGKVPVFFNTVEETLAVELNEVMA